MADSAVSVTMFSFEQVLVLSLDLKLLMLTCLSRARTESYGVVFL